MKQKNLIKFIERNAYDKSSKKEFDFFYSELYFKTTEELKNIKSIIKSKMISNNSIAITLSIFSLYFSFFTVLINIIKPDSEEQMVKIIFFILLAFIFFYVAYDALNEFDNQLTRKHKKLLLMVEAIDKLLSERKENIK